MCRNAPSSDVPCLAIQHLCASRLFECQASGHSGLVFLFLSTSQLSHLRWRHVFLIGLRYAVDAEMLAWSRASTTSLRSLSAGINGAWIDMARPFWTLCSVNAVRRHVHVRSPCGSLTCSTPSLPPVFTISQNPSISHFAFRKGYC